MSRANQRRMMTETRPSVYNRYKQYQKVRFLSYAWKYWTVQRNVSYVTVSSRLREHWRCLLLP